METNQMIETLRLEYDAINSIDPCLPAYSKLCDMLDAMDNNTISLFACAGIKWVSKLAMNRCSRRGLT